MGEVHRGREVLYRRGWNDDRLRLNAGPLTPTLNLDPSGDLVMQESRHPIWWASIARVLRRIVDDDARLARPDTPDAVYDDEGISSLEGRPTHCYTADLPAEADWVYAARVHICIDQATGMPARAQSWERQGGRLAMVEDYRFRDLAVNVGLADADFDPDNPAYGF